MLLWLLELIVAALIGVIVFTQVVEPLWRGTKLFPHFRRQGALESQLDMTRQRKTEAELERELIAAQRDLKNTKPKPRAGNPAATNRESE